MLSSYPSSAALRSAIVVRTREFCRLTGLGVTTISRRMQGKDPMLLTEIERGRNFTIGTYDMIMEWFDQNWPDSTER